MCGQLAGHAWGMNARQLLFSIHTNQLRSCISLWLRHKLVMGWGRVCASEAARIYVTPSQNIFCTPAFAIELVNSLGF